MSLGPIVDAVAEVSPLYFSLFKVNRQIDRSPNVRVNSRDVKEFPSLQKSKTIKNNKPTKLKLSKQQMMSFKKIMAQEKSPTKKEHKKY